MTGRRHILDETALGPAHAIGKKAGDDDDAGCEVAILPWGATEPHNLHLPFGTDTFQATAVAAEACRRAVERGGDAMVLPAVPFGANAQQLATPLTINLNPSTQARVLTDIVESLDHHGVGKLLIVNGHGGNAFKQMVRELQPRTNVFLCCTNWWTVHDPADYFDEPGDHAGELETSVMLHLRPDLVLPLDQAGPGRERRFRLKGLRDGVAWAPRDWAKVTEDTGVGDPSRATAEKGERFFADVCASLADFIVELSGADTGDLYESESALFTPAVGGSDPEAPGSPPPDR